MKRINRARRTHLLACALAPVVARDAQLQAELLSNLPRATREALERFTHHMTHVLPEAAARAMAELATRMERVAQTLRSVGFVCIDEVANLTPEQWAHLEARAKP